MSIRHDSDRVLYLCGDHAQAQWFDKAEHEIIWLTDFTVVNPVKGSTELLDRLKYYVDASDLVVVLPGFMASREAMAEIMYAEAVGIEVKYFEDVIEPFESVRDCD